MDGICTSEDARAYIAILWFQNGNYRTPAHTMSRQQRQVRIGRFIWNRIRDVL